MTLTVTQGARIALGQTDAGRYLRVIYVPYPEPDSVFVITASSDRGDFDPERAASLLIKAQLLTCGAAPIRPCA